MLGFSLQFIFCYDLSLVLVAFDWITDLFSEQKEFVKIMGTAWKQVNHPKIPKSSHTSSLGFSVRTAKGGPPNYIFKIAVEWVNLRKIQLIVLRFYMQKALVHDSHIRIA